MSLKKALDTPTQEELEALKGISLQAKTENWTVEQWRQCVRETFKFSDPEADAERIELLCKNGW